MCGNRHHGSVTGSHFCFSFDIAWRVFCCDIAVLSTGMVPSAGIRFAVVQAQDRPGIPLQMKNDHWNLRYFAWRRLC